MKKLILTILLVLIFSINLLSQIDFSDYTEISTEELEIYKYKIIYQYEDLNIIIVEIEGVIYVVYY